MRRTRKYFEARVKRFTRVAEDLKLFDPATQDISLSAYNPGDGMKYQIVVAAKEHGGTTLHFPKYHRLTKHFDDYLEGLLAGLEELYYLKHKGD